MLRALSGIYHSASGISLIIILFLFHSSLFSQENESPGFTVNPSIDFRYIGSEEELAAPKVPEGLTDFSVSSLSIFNQFGSFSLRNNGIKASVSTKNFNFFSAYLYQNYQGYRAHSSEYWHIAHAGIKTTPSANSSLTILGSYANGEIKLPGSLTKAEYEKDPLSADQRAVNRDEKTIPIGGSLDIKYKAKFGKSLNHEIEISAFSDLNNFRSATREYRIVNRYGIGIDARYSNTSRILNRKNTVSLGARLMTEPQRTEYYDNLGGQKSDLIEQLTSGKTSKTGIFLADTFEILRDKLFLLLAGKYDREVYKIAEQTLPSRSDKRTFSAFTPEIALDADLTSWLSLFGSFNLGFESPADIALESPDPFYLYNPTLKPQTSTNYNGGIKIKLDKKDSSRFLPSFRFRASYFRNDISNEIVPYEVFGDVFFRNAAKSNRSGLEVDTRLEIVRGLSIDLSCIFSQFRYGTYEAISIETDSTGNIVQIDRNFTKKNEPGIPGNFLNISLEYRKAFSKKFTLFSRVGYMGVSGVWVDDLNTEKTKSCGLLDAMVECEMKFGHFNLMASAGINNILDKGYVGLTRVNSADKRFYIAGAPRNYACGLNIGYSF
jgi:iron complex outermembrane recepter protein